MRRTFFSAFVLPSAAWRQAARPALDPQRWCSVAAAVSNERPVIADIGAPSPTDLTAIGGVIHVVRQQCGIFAQIDRVAGGVNYGATYCSIPVRVARGIANRLSGSGCEATTGRSSESSWHVASRAVWQNERSGPRLSQYDSLTRPPGRVTWSSPRMGQLLNQGYLALSLRKRSGAGRMITLPRPHLAIRLVDRC